MDTADLLIIQAPRLFSAAGPVFERGASLWIEGERITGVYGAEAPAAPAQARVLA